MFAFLIVTAHFSTITQDYNIAFFQKKSRGLVNHGLIFFVELANSTKNITPADRHHKKQHIVFCGLAVVNTTYFDNGGEIYGTKGKYAAGDY